MTDVYDYTKEGEKVSEEARKKSAEINPEDPLNKPEVVTPVSEIKDGEKAVDPKTGHADEASVPPSPEPTSEQQPEPHPAPQPAPQPQTPPQSQDPKPLVNSVVVSAKDFESKKKSFLNPDVDNGFWDTLDKKIKEALSGNTADEIGQNMAFAALTFLFDAIGNWATHHRKEAKRLKKEYEEKTKAFDDVLKNTLVEKYGAVAEYAIKMGIDIRTPEGRKKLKTLTDNKEFLGLCAGALSTTLMREVKPDEAKKLLEGTTKSLSNGNLALNSQEVANALGTQAAQDNAAYWDKRAKDQKTKVQTITQYREQLQRAKQDPHNQGKSETQIRQEVLQR